MMNRCQKSAWVLVCALTAPALAADPGVTADVIYGHKDGMALTYDVLHPERPNGAGVIYMVSGGWFSIWRPPGERIEGFQSLLSEGFAVFLVHHGSAPRFKVPDAVSDVRAAVRHIRDNAPGYGVDADRLGVFGGSAGGHLSLMLGLNAEAEPGITTGNPRSLSYAVDAASSARIAAVVAYFPPVDLTRSAGPNDRFPALDFDADMAPAISPVRFVTEDDPPVLLVHGTEDELVPISNSERLEARLKETGVTHELVVIEGAAHGFRGDHRTQATNAMVGWFKTHLAP